MTTTDPATGPEAVRLAIEHLDRVAPEGWRERVNLDQLDLTSLHNCVLGQIFRRSSSDYSGYRRGVLLLEDNDLFWSYRYTGDVYADDPEYREEWVRQLGGEA